MLGWVSLGFGFGLGFSLLGIVTACLLDFGYFGLFLGQFADFLVCWFVGLVVSVLCFGWFGDLGCGFLMLPWCCLCGCCLGLGLRVVVCFVCLVGCYYLFWVL